MKNNRTALTEITMSRLARFARAAFAAILAVSCSPDAVLSPTTSAELSPELKQVAIRIHVDARSSTATVHEPTLATDGAGASFATVQAPGGLLGGGAITLETGNVTRTTVVRRRTLVTFDVAIVNQLSSAELVTPTVPAPPSGVNGILLFPVRLTVTSGPTDKAVEESSDWDGSAIDFLGGITCLARAPSCAPYELYPAPILPLERTAARRVGFIVDRDVQAFDVFMIVTADQHDRPMGGIGGVAFSPTIGRLAGLTATLTPGGATASTDALGEFTFGRVDAGSYVVALGGVPENCPSPPAPKPVVVTANGAATAVFEIACNPAVTVTGVNPDNGASVMQTPITITGTNFFNVTGVTIGGRNVHSVNVVNSTTITGTIGTGGQVIGPSDVVVVSSTNGRGTCVACYHLNKTLTVTGITPNIGPLAGGGSFTITGTNFHNITDVIIGMDVVGYTVVSDSVITGTVPASLEAVATTVSVVSSSHGMNDCEGCYTYLPAMSIVGVSPANGPQSGGTTITISGANFVNITGVTIGGAPVVLQSQSATQIVGVTSAAATSGAQAVVVSSSSHGSATSAAGFTYNPLVTVTGVSPNNGPSVMQTPITITGTNFFNVTGVTIGGRNVHSVNVVNSTTITGTIATGGQVIGPSDVVVTSSTNGLGTCVACYTLNPTLTVTGIAPNNGPMAGGQSFTITGTGFFNVTDVIVGTDVVGFTVVSSTEITGTLPPAAQAGPASVSVVSSSHALNDCDGCFTYNPLPNVTAVTPNTGVETGLTLITIEGDNFLNVTGATIGGAPLAIQTVSATRIVALTPASSSVGAKDIAVSSSSHGTGSCAGCFTYTPAPVVVTSVTPDNGRRDVANLITIVGANFLNVTTVTVGGVAMTGVQVLSSTELRGSTPISTTSGDRDIVVNSSSRASGTCAGCFTYNPIPVVNAPSPNNGPSAGGTPITITGDNFYGDVRVYVGGWLTELTVVNPQTITGVTPASSFGAQSVVVQSSTHGNGGCANCFTYNAPPVVSGISPGFGPRAGGTAVTITGFNFSSDAAATIGGAAVTNLVVVNSQTITGRAPASATAGGKDVVVTSASAGTGTCVACFDYDPVITVTGASPNSGVTTGNAAVSISGSKFKNLTSVTIGGVALASYSYTETSIVGITGANTSGSKDIVVTSATHGTGTCSACYTYDFVAITSVSPASAGINEHATVTINGHFPNVAAVRVGGVQVFPQSVSTTTITMGLPELSPGVKDIVVQTNGFGSATCGGCFTALGITVTSVSPTSGSKSGGAPVTIFGTNFTSGMNVIIGNSPAAILFFSVDRVVVTAPASSTTGPTTVEVRSATRGSAVCVGCFTYTP